MVIEGFRRLMEDYSGDYSSASITDQIRNHDVLDLPSTTGATFKCDSTALAEAGVPIACTNAFAYTQLDAEGSPTTFTYVTG